jgi:hypothetical protein
MLSCALSCRTVCWHTYFSEMAHLNINQEWIHIKSVKKTKRDYRVYQKQFRVQADTGLWPRVSYSGGWGNYPRHEFDKGGYPPPPINLSFLEKAFLVFENLITLTNLKWNFMHLKMLRCVFNSDVKGGNLMASGGQTKVTVTVHHHLWIPRWHPMGKRLVPISTTRPIFNSALAGEIRI